MRISDWSSYVCSSDLNTKTEGRLILPMDYRNNILETIGNTPLVKINRLAEEIPALVLAKLETFNPGNSIKDRMALKRSEESSVGQECVRTCRSRWSP